jgi:tight adherence protein B
VILAEIDSRVLIHSVVMFAATAVAVLVGVNPLIDLICRREQGMAHTLQHSLLMNIPPRLITIAAGVLMVLLGLMGYTLLRGSLLAMFLAGGLGVNLPGLYIGYLKRKRIRRLEEQLVGGIQTLASGVRAGLNLVQSMQMVSRDGPVPMREEFAHLVREYDYGVPLDEAMDNAGRRIGSADYRLLFSALQTHRERGGDLGDTLDRIAASIREIQRLENRVQALTAQGRATARWLGAMPAVVIGVLYLIDPGGVVILFTEPVGNVILGVVFIFNVIGFLWIRKIMAIDI